MVRGDGVTLAFIDTNDVEAELGLHGLRQLSDLERLEGVAELTHILRGEPASEVSALGTGHRICRLSFGDVLELRATRDLVAQRKRMCAGRGCISTRNDAR